MEPIWYKSWPQGVPRVMDYPDLPLTEIIREHAREFPKREAINFYGQRISYGSLEKMITSFAAALHGLGVKKGDRVCLFMENCPQFIIGIFAVWQVGGVAVTSNPMYKEEELAHQLNDCGAEIVIALDLLYPVLHRVLEKSPIKKVIVTGYRDFLPQVPSLPLHPSLEVPRQFFDGTLEMVSLIKQGGTPPQVSLDPGQDLALLQYSSGFTHAPRGAMITHANMLANTICSAEWVKAGGRGVHLAVLPLFHVTGLMNSMNRPLYAGESIILLARYDTRTVIQAIEKYRCTNWVSIATMNIAVVNYPDVKKYDLSSLKACTSGGAPVPVEVLKEFEELTGARLVEGYGLSEAISQVSINPMDKPRHGSVGIPVVNTQVKILDLDVTDREVPLGQMGELWVKGPQITRGYWGKPRETEMCIKDGWLATGDIARMDEDGYLYIVGRKKELIRASGYSIFPAEVESFLCRHPAVSEAAVVGIPDPYRGESVKAYVVLKRGYENKVSEEDIIKWCREKMAAYKYPRVVEFLPELPRNGSGKIVRRLLTES